MGILFLSLSPPPTFLQAGPGLAATLAPWRERRHHRLGPTFTGGGPVTPDPPPRELLPPLSAEERRLLNCWYEVTGDYEQEGPSLLDILDWTVAEVREAVLTHTARAHPPPSPLGNRGYFTYAVWGPQHTSIVSAILCSLPPGAARSQYATS